MTLSYNIKFASQKLEFVQNTFMTEAEFFQRVFSKNEMIVQISIKITDNVIASVITDLNDVIVSNFVDVLQKTLRKTKIEKTVEFCAFSMFDEIMTLFIKSEFNAKLHREKLYRMINSKRYFDEKQQNLNVAHFK